MIIHVRDFALTSRGGFSGAYRHTTREISRMSSPLPFRPFLQSPGKKGVDSTQKSDLELLWENFHSPGRSPPHPHWESSSSESSIPTLFELLATHATPSTPKKLYCPPSFSSPVAEKLKEKALEFAYSSVCLSSTRPIVVPEEVAERRFFAFKGIHEHQEAAWKSFVQICTRAEFALISCISTVFFFHRGSSKAIGLTGTAHRRLIQISKNLPEIESTVVIEFIQEWIEKERIFLYSSEQFDYATVTPLTTKSAELQAATGRIYRVSLFGCLFAPTVDLLRAQNPGADIAKSILKF
jgi:hypothetical protein